MPDAIIQLVDRTVFVDLAAVGPRGAVGPAGTAAANSGVVTSLVGNSDSIHVFDLSGMNGTSAPLTTAQLSLSANVNVNTGDPVYPDNPALHIGFNVADGGGRIDAGAASPTMRIEYSFELTPDFFVSEFHWEMQTEGGATIRPLTAVVAHDGSLSYVISQVETFTIEELGGSNQVAFDMVANLITLTGMTLFQPANNVPVMQQHNAALDTVLNLPYINSANKYLIDQPVITTAGAEIGGSVNIDGAGNIELTVANATKTVALRSNNGGVGYPTCGSDTNDPFGIQTNGATRILIGAAGEITLSPTPPEFADDAAASAGGLAIGRLYKTGSVLKVRVA